MALEPGTRLGPYAIVSLIGSGGMGEVYRAHDARLDRDVAVKVLPADFGADSERLRRFEQEARAAAGLNHPNILAIHDVGAEPAVAALGASSVGLHPPQTYVVSELLEGQSLREALTTSSVPVRKAIDYAVQIARGLSAAHDKGIVHRDLKPENVFITADGRAKILDFGLAKLVERSPVQGSVATMSPTQAVGTTPGMILGTIGYMAPEQVRGLEVDHRADIFALGAILYEMLAGLRAFRGQTTADTLTAILKEDPPDLPAAERKIPPALARIVDRALEKSPAARFQSASDFAFALEGLSSQSQSTSALDAPVRKGGRAWVAWVLVGMFAVVAATLGGLLYRAARPTEDQAIRATILAPNGWTIDGTAPPNRLALSPDGRMLAFVARGTDRRLQIWVRRLDALSAQPLAGTEEGMAPFWSPDSRSIGFFVDGKLKKIDASGGAAQTICDAPGTGVGNVVAGGTWNENSVIVFSGGDRALRRVAATGGVATPLMKGAEPITGVLPWFLPDGAHVLYRRGGPNTGTDIETRLASTNAGSDNVDKTVLKGTSQVMYSQGHLMYVTESTLLAQPFDLDGLVTSGDAFPVAESVETGGGGNSAFSVSAGGTLVYQGGDSNYESQLVWIDASGRRVGTLGEPADYGDLVLSPDGTLAIVSVFDTGRRTRDLWLFDIARGVRTRFTFDPADDHSPVWSPDGKRVVFSSRRKQVSNLYVRDRDATTSEQVLLEDKSNKSALSWSRDGRYLLFTRNVESGGNDLWVLPLDDRKPKPFLQTAFNEVPGEFSPDGNWIAYASNESGRAEIYIAPFPGPGGKVQLSTNGGTQPRWRDDGREVFFISTGSNELLRVPIRPREASLEPGHVESILKARLRIARSSLQVAPGGQRLLINTIIDPDAVAPITLVVNWRAGR